MTENNPSFQPQKSPLVRGLMISAGIAATALGFIGIFVPLLPTTPFLLLASWLFVRSSRKFHDRLMTNRFFGPYIKNYREKRGITLRNKIYSLTFLWITLSTSFIFAPPLWYIWLMLASIGIGVTVHIIKFKTLK